MTDRRIHRTRHKLHSNGHEIEPPSPPPALSASRRRSWVALWASDAGRTTAAAPGGPESAYRLYELYRELDGVIKLLRSSPTMTIGSLGQDRVNPLASRHMQLTTEVRMLEKTLGLGGPVNARRLPEVEEAPGYLLAKINTLPPSLDYSEFGGFDPRLSRGDDMPDDHLERLAAEYLRKGRPFDGEPGWGERKLSEIASERGIDPTDLLKRARKLNKDNAALLLTAWRETLAEARAELAWATPGTDEEIRLRARVAVYSEYVALAEEKGVTHAQDPGHRDQLAG